MLGPVGCLGSQPPGPRPEAGGEEQEKHSDHFEENDVSHAAEGSEESAYAPANRARGNARTARRCNAGGRLWRTLDDRCVRGCRRPRF